MQKLRHSERHFQGSDTLRDVVIGMSDGLTVPFALAAGLSGAVASSHLVVTAGLAEIVAGAISMALGGYLAGRSAREHYEAERKRESREVVEVPGEEAVEVAAVFARYGLSRREIEPILAALRARPEAWVDFMMHFELGLERPDPQRALFGALTIGGAYAAGGIIPLFPYLIWGSARSALGVSIALTASALVLFGLTKGRFTGAKPWRSALETVLIGGLAATAAYLAARLIA
jgi:VIT1/CCC1 family predicted Fe2+/Mn2+ transporter